MWPPLSLLPSSRGKRRAHSNHPTGRHTPLADDLAALNANRIRAPFLPEPLPDVGERQCTGTAALNCLDDVASLDAGFRRWRSAIDGEHRVDPFASRHAPMPWKVPLAIVVNQELGERATKMPLPYCVQPAGVAP